MSRPLCASSHANDTHCGSRDGNKTTIAIDRCPQCQFRFGWNGTYCQHCWYGASGEIREKHKAKLAALSAKYQAEAALDAALRRAAKKKISMVTAIANTIANIIAVIAIIITALASIDLSLKFDSERGIWRPLGEALIEFIGRLIMGLIEGLFSD